MNPHPLLSIITISKADLGGLDRTHAALARWRACSWVEHLVVTPDSVAVSGDTRVVPDGGQGRSEAFNLGLVHARGTWIWFINGGDTPSDSLEPEWLHSLLQATDADILCGSVRYLPSGRVRTPAPIDRVYPLLECWPQHPGTFVRSRLLNAAPAFQPSLRCAMDFDLWLRVMRPGMRVDCIGVTIADFFEGGISNHPKSLARMYREDTRLLARNLPRSLLHHLAGLVRAPMALARSARRWLRT